MAKLIQEEEVRYYADFIDEIYHDDGTVSEFKRVACDITKCNSRQNDWYSLRTGQ